MKKQNMEITDELLACYLEGKATKEELAAIVPTSWTLS